MQGKSGSQKARVILQPQSLDIINDNTSPRNSSAQLSNLWNG